ncbi:MAG TPA: DUF5906 domain-containing protein [Nitrospira sp.]|nr:DUF5906 domain-containing protein [Nitrospira sp.]
MSTPEVRGSTYEKAQELLTHELYLFPSEHKKKHIKGWPEKASRDPKKIKEWLGPGGTHESWKISIFTGKLGDGKSLVVVDNDPRHGGDETIRAIEAQHPDAFPPTREHRTAGGGSHRLYWTTWPGVKSGAGVLGPGVDIKSAGGLVHFGDGYDLINDLPIAEASKYLLAQCKPVGSTSRPPSREQVLPSVAINQEHANSRAEWYLAHDAKPSIQGQGGDQNAFFTAAKLKDFGVDESAATLLMWEFWNDRCEPPFYADELETKVRNAYRYGQNPPGIDAPEVVFARSKSAIEDFNRDHALVTTGGGVEVLYNTLDRHGNPAFEHLDVGACKIKYAARKIFDGKKDAPLFDEWLRSPIRNSYDGYVFKPGQPGDVIIDGNGHTKKFFNLWRPPAFAPAPSGATHPAVDQFLEHSRYNMCRGAEELFRWLIAYCAQLVQRPWEKPHVALVFRGGKGVGKNAWVECIRSVLGPHSLVTSDRRYLMGNFNAHLENCLLLVFDEAFWSGDKQIEGMVKNLITGTEHIIERKGKESYAVDNLTRVVIIGNEDWLFPASPDERRIAFFDVGDRRKQDHPFFKSMLEGMKSGGAAVLWRYLMDYDISGINLNLAPVTSGLLDQKLLSNEPWLEYWRGCLRDGQIAGSEFEGWPSSIDCKRFQMAMRQALNGRNIKGWIPSEESIGRKMKPLGLRRDRQRVRRQERSPEGPEFVYVYHIPELPEVRRLFDVFMGQPTQWEAEE